MNVQEGVSWEAVAGWAGAALGIVTALWAAVLSRIGWYHIQRLDDVIGQVSDMREKYVTREELQATITRSERSFEERHGQSMDSLKRIESAMGENYKEAKQDRKEMRDVVYEVALSVAALTGKSTAVAEIADTLSKALANRKD